MHEGRTRSWARKSKQLDLNDDSKELSFSIKGLYTYVTRLSPTL